MIQITAQAQRLMSANAQCPFCDQTKKVLIKEFDPETGCYTDNLIDAYTVRSFINFKNKNNLTIAECFCPNCGIAFTTQIGIL